MQETNKHTGVSLHDRACPSKGKDTVRYQERKCGASEKTPASVNRAGNDYLKQAFGDILASKVGCGLQESIGPDTKDAVYLNKSVENYFRLMGKTLNVVPSGCFELDAFNLYHALRDNLPEMLGINFDRWKGKLSVILFDDDIKFPDYTLFYIPICGAENMGESLRATFLQFLSFVRQTQKIDIPCENSDFNYVVTEYGGGYMDDGEDNWKELYDMSKRYDTGDIGAIMDKISSPKVIEAELIAELNTLLAEDTDHAHEGLISMMLTGIKLLRQDCIFNYDYCPRSANYDDYQADAIGLDRSLCFCWGNEVDDPVVRMAIELYNNEQQELETYGPASYLVLEPDTNSLLEKSDFPARFAKWYGAFYEKLQKYMGDGTYDE